MPLSRRSAICAVSSVALGLRAEPRWSAVYRYAGSEPQVSDLAASDSGLIAVVGSVSDSDRRRGFCLVSQDGSNWKDGTLGEVPTSVSIVDAATLWVATSGGLWKSIDRGQTWKRQLAERGLERVCFLNAEHGYATGQFKKALESGDGGSTWAPIDSAAEPDTSSEYTVYHWVHFATPKVGIITGTSRPPRRGHTSALPVWRDPLASQRRPEWPAASLTLETRDGGVTWKHTNTSLFGRITRVRYTKDGRGLALVEFHDAFEWPSEVFAINLRTSESVRVYRESNRAVTDVLPISVAEGYLAAIEPPKDASQSTFGKLRILKTENLVGWDEMALPAEIDAGRAFLAAGGGRIWAATDTGFILRL